VTRRDAALLAAGATAGAAGLLAAAAGWVWWASRAALVDEQVMSGARAYWEQRAAERARTPFNIDEATRPPSFLVDRLPDLAEATGMCRDLTCGYGRLFTDTGHRCDRHQHTGDPVPDAEVRALFPEADEDDL
jgi:hypothetical protein